MPARLESANKVYGTQLLISEAVYEVVQDHFVTRCVDHVAMKGKSRSTSLYEVMGHRKTASHERRDLARAYEEALELYFAGDFGRAESLFRHLEQTHDDVASGHLAERCRRYLDDPPEDFSGVFKMTRK